MAEGHENFLENIVKHANELAKRHGKAVRKPPDDGQTESVAADLGGFHVRFVWPSKAKNLRGLVEIKDKGKLVFDAQLEPEWTEEEPKSNEILRMQFDKGPWRKRFWGVK